MVPAPWWPLAGHHVLVGPNLDAEIQIQPYECYMEGVFWGQWCYHCASQFIHFPVKPPLPFSLWGGHCIPAIGCKLH